jgi:hypothetical protein
MGLGMQNKPSSRGSQSLIVFSVVAVVALGSTLVSGGLGRGARGRLAEARVQLDAECMDVVGAGASIANSCMSGVGLQVIPELKLGQQDLAAARAATRDGDVARAATSLVRVLERADRVDRRWTLVASLVTGKLVDGVADAVDANPALLDEPRLASAVRRAAFSSGRRPLESERLRALARLAEVPSQLPLRTAGLAEATVTVAMRDVDTTLRAMENALLRHDTSACEQAAGRATGLAAQVTVGPSICRTARHVVDSRDRLEALRARADVRGRSVHTSTARVTFAR